MAISLWVHRCAKLTPRQCRFTAPLSCTQPSACLSMADQRRQALGAGKQSILEQYVLGVVSAATATSFTHPIDSVKVRLQTSTATGRGPSLLGLLREVPMRTLYKGLPYAYLRNAFYSGARLIIYNHVRFELGVPPTVSGMFAGAAGSMLAAPFESTLVRRQLSVVVPRRSVLDFWRGCSPSVMRATLVSVGQLSVYDSSKCFVEDRVLPWLHIEHRSALVEGGIVLSAGAAAGLSATLLSHPADLVKTRMMSTGKSTYRNPVDCLVQLLRKEGVRALYKGVSASAIRQFPQTVVSLSSLELYSRMWASLAKS